MNRIKRIIAMALAVMIVVPMVGNVTGYAATTIENNKGPTSTWIAGSAALGFEFTVKDVQSNITLVDADVPVGTELTIGASSDFEVGVGTLKIDKVIPEPGQNSDTVKYLVKAVGLKHKSASTAAVLKFTVAYNNGKGSVDVTVTVPKMSTSSGGGGTPETPEDTSGNARYTLRKVSSPKNGSGTILPASPPRYDIDNITSSSDATVRQNYFVDISVKFSDANLPIGASQLVAGDVDTSDLGSFVYDSASPVEVRNASGGYSEIVFKNIRYTGNGKKLAFRVDNKDGYSKDIVAALSECVTRQEANANASSKPSDDDTDSKIESETPYVIINQYGYGGGTVTAGETFSLSMTFLNTSDSIDVSNMMITVTMPTDLMLTSSSNTFYVPTLETQKSITKSVQVTAKADAKAMSHNIGASMKYQYIDHRVNTRRSAETTENIAIPVVQVDRFQVTAVEIPMDIMMDEETSVTVSFVNKGRSEAYNLSASIDGNILNPGQTQNLGNLASGMTGTADFFVKPSAAGQLNGNITITYEDTNMEEKTATIPYNATVKTMEEMNGGGMIGGGGMFPGGEMMPGEGEVMPEDTKPQWPIFVVIGVAVLIPAGIVAKKIIDKKRKEREDADL